MECVQTQEREGLRVTTAVLDRDEAKRPIGVDVSKKGIQPAWIESKSDVPYTVALTGIDSLTLRP